MRPKAKLNDGRTPLHVAAENGHNGAIRMLVKELGVDKDVRCDSTHTRLHFTESGWTPLHFAVQGNRHEAIRVLVTELGADIEAFSVSDGTPLSLAVSSSRPDVATVRLLGVELVANGAARLQDGMTVLHVAAQEGNCDTVRVLVEEMGVVVKLSVRQCFDTGAQRNGLGLL